MKSELTGYGVAPCVTCEACARRDAEIERLHREIERLWESMSRPCEACGHEGDLFLVCGFCRDKAAEVERLRARIERARSWARGEIGLGSMASSLCGETIIRLLDEVEP